MTYTIGEVEEVTGVKAHVLRYWDGVIPGFAPRKNLGRRRIYTERDLDLVQRMKYLIYERKFTIEGARDEILRQTARYDEKADLLDAIRQIRAELTEIYFITRRSKK